jgi:hypothetical protein
VGAAKEGGALPYRPGWTDRGGDGQQPLPQKAHHPVRHLEHALGQDQRLGVGQATVGPLHAGPEDQVQMGALFDHGKKRIPLAE